MVRPQRQFRAQTTRLLDLIVLDIRARQIREHDGSDKYFAGKLGVSPRQVQSYVRSLREAGSIEVATSRFKLGPSSWANVRKITPKEAQN